MDLTVKHKISRRLSRCGCFVKKERERGEDFMAICSAQLDIVLQKMKKLRLFLIRARPIWDFWDADTYNFAKENSNIRYIWADIVHI